MKDELPPFEQRYREALADPRLPRNLLAFQRNWRRTRDAAFQRLTTEAARLGASTPGFAAARQRLRAAKDGMLADPGAMRARFVSAAESNGTVVHQVATAAQARATILEVLTSRTHQASRRLEDPISRRVEDVSSRTVEDLTSRRPEHTASRGPEDSSSRRREDLTSRALEDKPSRRLEDPSSRTLEDDPSRRLEDPTSRRPHALLLAKGKSMVAEEIFLNHFLEHAGLQVVETDLGEWIIQLAHETPSHMVMPAIHKSRHQVADLFERETGQPVPRDDIKAQVTLARERLRQIFLRADAGMIGANALIAETGSVVLVTNEGNGDLVSTLPRLLIVIAGWEKILPDFAAASAHLRLLARSGTGQEITTYTSFITGPEPGCELHLVLVDNGRTEMWSDSDARAALRCIRCAACADVCPPYQVVGGHVFGYVYSGAIGLVNTPFHHGLAADAGPQSLCVSCNACATVCPVEIPLPQQILSNRRRVVETFGLPWYKRAAFAIWSRPAAFDAATRAGAAIMAPLRRRDGLLRAPLPRAWAWRTAPALAPRPARDASVGRTFEPFIQGPWTSSGARGLTVAYFLQCVADRFAPEQIDAALAVLRACGARVIVPTGQHCCGLPGIDAGHQSTAVELAKQTIQTLEAVSADYIVTGAASCAIAMLHDYPRVLRDEPEWAARAERLAARTLDLLSFLDKVADPPALPRRANGPVVTYHSFCQSTNVLGILPLGPRLLERAGIQLEPLAEMDVCCGFGGGASIDHPEVSRGIALRKLDNVRETRAAVLCTDNPGCVLHLKGAADAAGLQVEVVHVAEVLARAVRQF